MMSISCRGFGVKEGKCARWALVVAQLRAGRFVPHPIFGSFVREEGVSLDGVGEVVNGDVAVGEGDGGDELFEGVGDLGLAKMRLAATVMPLVEAAVQSCGRLEDDDVFGG